MIRAVSAIDTPGPLDEQARVLLERVLAQKPVVIGIVFQSANSSDMLTLPAADMVERGIADWMQDNFPRKGEDE
jgi:hypothetical protein